MAFAGLWEGFRWPDGAITRTFTIVTTNASADVAGLRDRMPVILEPAQWPAWLGEAGGDPAALLHPVREGTLRCWPVSRRVNAPRNNVPDLAASGFALENLPCFRMVPGLRPRVMDVPSHNPYRFDVVDGLISEDDKSPFPEPVGIAHEAGPPKTSQGS
jgi:SOS response associated peptidase (SRAP)